MKKFQKFFKTLQKLWSTLKKLLTTQKLILEMSIKTFSEHVNTLVEKSQSNENGNFNFHTHAAMCDMFRNLGQFSRFSSGHFQMLT